jgi:N-acetylmuramoyl-L-alanine amidase
MTDDANGQRREPRLRRRAPDEGAVPPAAASPPAADDDPLAALERLQSLTAATDLPPSRDNALPPASPPPVRRSPRVARPRPAGAPRAGRTIARIAAPVVFLLAVIVVLSIVVQSGVVGGTPHPLVTPTPKATKTKSTATAAPVTYKVYVIKAGDTLTGIAVKAGTTVSDIEALNPRISSSTLVVGAKIKIPKTVP